jgi:hypothetical protein
MIALYARMHPREGKADLAVRLWEKDTGKSLALAKTDVGSSTTAAFSPDGSLALGLASTGPSPASFTRVGHCLWALLVACVGGIVGRACHANGPRGRVQGCRRRHDLKRGRPFAASTVPFGFRPGSHYRLLHKERV